jgi:NTP pyrophosphatase (non-canonical NTP hydrolase)
MITDFDGSRIMTFNEYQDECAKTDVGTSAQDNLKPGWMYYVLGIGGETGELLEKIKKLFRDDYGEMTEERKKAVILEMGDMMWYMARLCSHLGVKFDQVALMNVDKLQSRKKREKIHGDGDIR